PFGERAPGSQRSPAPPVERAVPSDRPSAGQAPGEGGRRGGPDYGLNNVRPGSEPRRPRSRGRGASEDLSQTPVRYFTSDANGEPPAAASADASSSILLTWTPPVEEGDDRPLLGGMSAADEGSEDEGEPTAEERLDYAEVFVDVGRRDGARPSDIQKVLRDRGGISRRETGHIRVRDKHAFVLVRRELLDRALEALQGSIIAGRTVKAEPARERPNDAQG
ncbi:MAG TPA: DbpA RNA binding domain-containing protein, partial [Polyangiaceae bacterium]|nr:DbpA RNA binding domain-containing protein [Polyangiaceae bacterium]